MLSVRISNLSGWATTALETRETPCPGCPSRRTAYRAQPRESRASGKGDSATTRTRPGAKLVQHPGSGGVVYSAWGCFYRIAVTNADGDTLRVVERDLPPRTGPGRGMEGRN